MTLNLTNENDFVNWSVNQKRAYLLLNGLTYQSLAKEMNVSRSAICQVINNNPYLKKLAHKLSKKLFVKEQKRTTTN